MKVSLAEVRRQLAVGTEFTGEFVGVYNQRCSPGMQDCQRRVVKQTAHQMVCELLTGPRKGELIYLTWSGCTATAREGCIVIASEDVGGEFLRVTIGGSVHV